MSRWAGFFMRNADQRYEMKINKNISNPKEDLQRDMNQIFINAKPLSDYAQPNGKQPKTYDFTNDRDILNFFNEVLLKDFEGDENQRMDAMKNICLILHQGGILYPTTTAITDVLKADDGKSNTKGSKDTVSLLPNSQSIKQKTNIITTKTGFIIQNNCGFGAITALQGSKLATNDYGKPVLEDFPDQSDYSLNCDPGYKVLIQATGVANVNLLKKDPVIQKEHLQISVGNKGLAAYLSPSSFKEAFINFLKNVLNLNKPPTIKVEKQGPVRQEEKPFIDSFIEQNKEMLTERSLYKEPSAPKESSKISSEDDDENTTDSGFRP